MPYTIVDSHAHIIPVREPVWGWGPNFTAERLLAMMDRDYDVLGETKHVGAAIVMTGLGLTSIDHRSMQEAHEYAIRSVKQHSERLYLNAVINPRNYVPQQLDELKGWRESNNLRMLKLHPSMHNYYLPTYSPFPSEEHEPEDDLSRIRAGACAERAGDDPHGRDALRHAGPDRAGCRGLSGRPDRRGSLRSQQHPGQHERRDPAYHGHGNVYLGVSWVQPPELVQMYCAIGARKMIWESDCSPQSMGQTLPQ